MTGTVRALEWREYNERHFASSHGVSYEIACFDVDGWSLNTDLAPEWTACGKLPAAKSAAQSHFNGYILSALTASASEPAPSFQERVQPWMMACFGEEISNDRVERGDRLLEEVFELLQSGGYDPGRVLPLRDYVWSREVGEPPQEAGGVQVTMAAYCLAHGLDMHEAGETELARIWTKVEQIRAKQAAKPKHSPLAVPASEPEPVAWRWKPKGSAVLWIYDPKPEWLAAQDPATIDKEPLYAKPVPTPDGAVEALRRAKQTLERYHRAGLGDDVFHSDLTDALRVVNTALETPWQKPGRAAQAQAGEKPDFPADEQSGETSHGAVTDAMVEADGWRDIESAPKDGSRILSAKNFGGNVHEAAIIRWSETEDEWWDDDADQYAFPDLWMPLPAPLAAHPADGWRLVPEQPTPNMLGAWYQYKNGYHFPGDPPPPDTSDVGAYKAMLAAAPAAKPEGE